MEALTVVVLIFNFFIVSFLRLIGFGLFFFVIHIFKSFRFAQIVAANIVSSITVSALFTSIFEELNRQESLYLAVILPKHRLSAL